MELTVNDYYTRINAEFDELDYSKLRQLHCSTIGPVEWFWTDVSYVLSKLKTPFWSQHRPNRIWLYEYNGSGIIPGFGQDQHHMCAVYHYINPADGISLFYDTTTSETPVDKLGAKQNETWLVNTKVRQTMYFPDTASNEKRRYLGFMYEAPYEQIRDSLL